MKTPSRKIAGNPGRFALFCFMLAILNVQFSTLLAQGTAFTYQGRLNDSGTPYTGSAEFQATLWSVPSGGTALASNAPAAVIVGVTNGLFVLPLNFGASFPGGDRWLQLEVRTVIGPFTTLTPRQQLTPTPYAITASNLTGNLPAGQLSGTIGAGSLSGTYSNVIALNNPANLFVGSFTGNGAGVTNVNAATLGGLSSSNFWKLGGNAGANPTNGNFLGTTDNLPLEIKVNGTRALRLEPNANGAPNVIGGSPRNFVAAGVVGATIIGGGATNYAGVPYTNSVLASFGSVLGGRGNTASGNSSTAMGNSTTASGDYSTAMGHFTTASSNSSTAMGYATDASGNVSTALGFATEAEGGSSTAMGNNTIARGSASTAMGSSTIASGSVSTAMGNNTIASGNSSTTMGNNTTAAGDYSFAAGRRAMANHDGAFVWGDSQNTDFASTTNNQFLIRAEGGVGIGTEAPNSQLHVNGDGVDPSLRVQVAGSSKLIVAANGGTAVGANTTPPVNGLYVSGDVGIGRSPAVNTLEVNGTASKSTAGEWLANSDARIKQSIEPVTSALDTLNKVRLVSFRYTDDYRSQHKGIDDRRYLNVIAQEFREVFPEHVKSSGEKLSDGSDILQVDIHPLTIYSAAAVQELNSKLNSQTREMTDGMKKVQAKLSEKETEIAELKQRIEALEKAIRANTITSR